MGWGHFPLVEVPSLGFLLFCLVACFCVSILFTDRSENVSMQILLSIGLHDYIVTIAAAHIWIFILSHLFSLCFSFTIFYIISVTSLFVFHFERAFAADPPSSNSTFISSCNCI